MSLSHLNIPATSPVTYFGVITHDCELLQSLNIKWEHLSEMRPHSKVNFLRYCSGNINLSYYE